MKRIYYQRTWARGRVVNVGCNNDPAGFGDQAVHVDLDAFAVPNFVRADAHALPFADRSFDSAVLGDVLEHCLDPHRVLKEACRVARRVVGTVPEELRLPSVGQHLDEVHRKAEDVRRILGEPDLSDDAAIIEYSRRNVPGFLDGTPESVLPHTGHINRFDDAAILALIEAGCAGTDLRPIDLRRAREPELDNWLFVLGNGYAVAKTLNRAQGWASVPGWLLDQDVPTLRSSVHSTSGAIVVISTWPGRLLGCLASLRSERLDGESRTIYDVALLPRSVGDRSVYLVDEMLENLFEIPRLRPTIEFGTGDRVGLLAIDNPSDANPSQWSGLADALERWRPRLARAAEIVILDHGDDANSRRDLQAFAVRHPDWYQVAERSRTALRLRRDRIEAAPIEVAAAPTETSTGRSLEVGAPLHHGVPEISVLYPTWRLGGLDLLRAGLARQSLAPGRFEVLVADALYGRRGGVAELFADAPYRVTHLEPAGNRFPFDGLNQARNALLNAARAPVTLWLTDYAILAPDALERHLEVVRRGAGRAVSCGTHVYGAIRPGALHPDLLRRLPVGDHGYAALVGSLTSDSPLWTSIFHPSFAAAPAATLPSELGRTGAVTLQEGRPIPFGSGIVQPDAEDGRHWQDPKLQLLNGPIDPIFFHAKNEAGPRELFERAGGWNEAFDGGKGYDDSEMARRLSAVGAIFVLDKGNECFVPNPRPFFAAPRRRRAAEYNKTSVEAALQCQRSA